MITPLETKCHSDENKRMKLIALDLPFESSMSVGTKVLAY